jgi:hypothetical protein
MLVATWILAVATALLALSGPVALFAWLGARQQDRERRQREREDEIKNQVLRTAREEFTSKNTLQGTVALGAIAVVIGWGIWNDRKK